MSEQDTGGAARVRQPAELIDALLELLARPRTGEFYAQYAQLVQALCRAEAVLVVDATTGGNALVQAREFKEATGLTGVIVTKLDGSGKGGCIIAIQNELEIPTRFIGTGERLEDMDFFEARRFVEQMI